MEPRRGFDTQVVAESKNDINPFDPTSPIYQQYEQSKEQIKSVREHIKSWDEVEQAKFDFENVAQNIANHQMTIKEYEAAIVKMSKEQEKITDELVSVTVKLDALEFKTDILHHQQTIKIAEEEKSKYETEIAQLNKAIIPLDHETASLHQKISALEIQQQIDLNQRQINVYQSQMAKDEVYFHQQIKLANERIASLAAQLDPIENEAQVNMLTMDEIANKLQKCKNRKSEMVLQMTQLDGSIIACEEKMKVAQQAISDLTGKIFKLPEDVAKYIDLQDEAELKEHLIELRAKKDILQEAHTQYLLDMNAKRTAILAEANKIEQLEQRKNTFSQNDRLQQFWYAPEEIYNELVTKIQKQLNDYDDAYPAGQRAEVRMCLAEMKNNLPKFSQVKWANKEKFVSEQDESNFHVRYRYYLLCGWLSLQRLKLGVSEENRAICKVMEGLITSAKKDLKSENRLPGVGNDILKAWESTCTVSSVEYMTVQRTHHDQIPGSIEEKNLHELEVKEYVEARKGFLDVLDTLPGYLAQLRDLHARGRSLIAYMDGEQQRANKPGRPAFDLHYATKILTTSKELMQKPDDKVLQNKYHRLIDCHTVGAPSTAKKAKGLMLAFLGAVIIAGCVLTALATFGAATPLSLIVGATVAAEVVAVTTGVGAGAAIAATASVGAVGVGAAVGGGYLFYHGTRRGPSKGMAQFFKANLARCGEEPALEDIEQGSDIALITPKR